MKRKKIVCLLMIVVCVFSLVSCRSEKSVLRVGKTGLTESEFRICYAICYADFLSSYDTESLGFDPTADLRKQSCAFRPSVSWGDYLLETAASFCRELVVVTEEAKKNGVTLTAEEKQSVHDGVFGTEEEPLDTTLWETMYGKGVTCESVESVMASVALYRKYYDILRASFPVTEEEIAAYYEKNRADIDTYTLRIVPFEYADGTHTASEAKKAAKAFVESVSSEADIREKAVTEVSTAMLSYFGLMTDFTLTYNVTPSYFGQSSSATRWMTSETRSYLDSFVYDTGGLYLALFYIEKDTKDYAPVTLRHILISDDDGKGRETAEKLLDDWKNGLADEDSFAVMASLVSADTATASNGGLYRNIGKGYLTNEITEWAFSPARRAGDSAVLRSAYGYHVLYFSERGTGSYRDLLCRTELEAEAYADFMENAKGYDLSYDKQALSFVFD